jgi:chemotaxis protein methyltransferase CheR
VLPNENDYINFYKNFKRRTGVDLNLYKQDQIRRRLIFLVGQRKLKTFAELANEVAASNEAAHWVLDKLAINVTEVFRNPELWGDLEAILKNDLKAETKSLRIWSAGCSVGAEAFSIAAVLHQFNPKLKHQIICTDIDQGALDQAAKGEFLGAEFREVPKKYKEYFQHDGRRAVADERLKSYVRFQRQNLLSDPYGRDYDLIVCRNVLIYFVDEAKAEIYKKFNGALRPGGFLFVGGSERIFDYQDIGYETTKPYFYKKVKEERVKWQNAS